MFGRSQVLRSICGIAFGCLAVSGAALSREKKPADNAMYSVLAVSADGKVTIEAVASSEVAARRSKLLGGRPVARQGDAQAPALIVLCENVKGKRKAEGLVRTIRTTLARASGAAPQEKKTRTRKKAKKKTDPDGGDEGGGGGEGSGKW
jgi:hypothetical protein